MTVSIYLAGPSSDLERVKRAATELDKSELFEITYRWWLAVDEHASKGAPDKTLDREEQAKYARLDLDGIDHAQLIWCLWPSVRGDSEGVPVELGAALLLSQLVGSAPVIVSGTRCHECIFTALADFRDSSDEVAFHEVMKLARKLSE